MAVLKITIEKLILTQGYRRKILPHTTFFCNQRTVHIYKNIFVLPV